MQLIIASHNIHKVREFRSILKKLSKFDVQSLLDFPEYRLPPENGQTFEENAIIKATHAAKALNTWVIADDSGLVVPALQGSPGIFSARYAGEGATDAENRKKLLHEMQNIPETERQAYFECWIALASPEGLKKCVRGICEGMILPKERGSNGFGYDPLFLKYDYNKSFAELEEETKNRISHRRKAIDKILLTLESLSK